MRQERRPIEWGIYAIKIPASALVAAVLWFTGTEIGGVTALILAVVVGFGLLDLTGELLARLVGWESAE